MCSKKETILQWIPHKFILFMDRYLRNLNTNNKIIPIEIIQQITKESFWTIVLPEMIHQLFILHQKQMKDLYRNNNLDRAERKFQHIELDILNGMYNVLIDLTLNNKHCDTNSITLLCNANALFYNCSFIDYLFWIIPTSIKDLSLCGLKIILLLFKQQNFKNLCLYDFFNKDKGFYHILSKFHKNNPNDYQIQSLIYQIYSKMVYYYYNVWCLLTSNDIIHQLYIQLQNYKIENGFNNELFNSIIILLKSLTEFEFNEFQRTPESCIQTYVEEFTKTKKIDHICWMILSRKWRRKYNSETLMNVICLLVQLSKPKLLFRSRLLNVFKMKPKNRNIFHWLISHSLIPNQSNIRLMSMKYIWYIIQPCQNKNENLNYCNVEYAFNEGQLLSVLLNITQLESNNGYNNSDNNNIFANRLYLQIISLLCASKYILKILPISEIINFILNKLNKCNDWWVQENSIICISNILCYYATHKPKDKSTLSLLPLSKILYADSGVFLNTLFNLLDTISINLTDQMTTKDCQQLQLTLHLFECISYLNALINQMKVNGCINLNKLAIFIQNQLRTTNIISNLIKINVINVKDNTDNNNLIYLINTSRLNQMYRAYDLTQFNSFDPDDLKQLLLLLSGVDTRIYFQRNNINIHCVNRHRQRF